MIASPALPFSRRQPRARLEDAIQRGIVAYLATVLPAAVIHANANAARRTEYGRPANAVPGLLPGIPDIEVCIGVATLYFEVKTPVGRLSDVQEDVIGRLREIGTLVEVVTGIDDVREALRRWNIATREVMPA